MESRSRFENIYDVFTISRVSLNLNYIVNSTVLPLQKLKPVSCYSVGVNYSNVKLNIHDILWLPNRLCGVVKQKICVSRASLLQMMRNARRHVTDRSRTFYVANLQVTEFTWRDADVQHSTPRVRRWCVGGSSFYAFLYEFLIYPIKSTPLATSLQQVLESYSEFCAGRGHLDLYATLKALPLYALLFAS